MSVPPPKVLKRHVKSRTAAINTNLKPTALDDVVTAAATPKASLKKPVARKKNDITRKPDNAPQLKDPPESLPILQAFQEFLDHERRRTRNRIAALTAFFLVTLAAITVTGLLVGKTFMDQIRNDFDDVREDVDAGKTQVATMNSDVTAVKDQIVETLTRITGESEAMRKQILKEKQDLDEVQARMKQQARSHSDRVTGMKEVVDLLKVENEGLKKNVSDMHIRWENFLKDQEAVALRATPLPPAHTLVTAVDTDVVSGTVQTLAFSILPLGNEHPVPWRLAIPE